MRFMRVLPVFVLLWLLSAGTAAQNQKGPQIEAAKADAIESLKRRIISSHVTSDLTVEDFLERLDAGAELDRTLAGAEQLGGARWLGDQAVEVRLSIDGARIAKMLIQVAESRPRQSPVSPEMLKRQLKWWTDRIFSATGTSTDADDISRLRPPIADRAWWSVGDADRRRAVASARDHAVDHVFQNLASIKLEGDKTLGAAISPPDVSRSVRDFLGHEPVKSVEFKDDLTVRLTLGDAAAEVWPLIRSALSKQGGLPQPANDADWERLQKQVATCTAEASGVGTVQPPEHVAGPATTLPAEPPAWSKEQVETQATSPQDGSPLHTSRRAEALAVEKLRDQINRLPLSPGGTTIGSAAGKDPRIEQAVLKAISRARPSQVDYGAHGAVTVHVTLRLADLWALMSGQE
jgi:hypothetical protein